MPLRIIFAGTPQFSVPCLQALIDSKHEVVAVYCQPDRKQGRGQITSAPPCKQLAIKHAIPVEQPASLRNDQTVSHLQSYSADLMVVVAYGLILPPAILNTPRLGCVNIHGSLLPAWRGAAPIQRAIQAGDTTTGVTLMQMDEGMDTGDMLLKAECAINPGDNHSHLAEKLSQLGAKLLIEGLEALEQNQLIPEPQEHTEATYAHKLHKSEATIDWSLSAKQIDQHIRAFNPWPIAETQCPKGRLRIHHSECLDDFHDEAPGTILACHNEGIDVATHRGTLRIKVLQLDNQKATDAKAFYHGHKQWLVPQQCRLG